MATISNTADQASDFVKDAASHTKSTFFDLSTQVMKMINNAREAEGRGVDMMLDRLGLQRRQSALGPVLWFTAGAVVAGTAVLLFAPTSGQSLRQRLAKFIDSEVKSVATQAKAAEQRVEDGIKSTVSTLRTDASDLKTDASGVAKRPPNGAKHEIG